MAGALVILAACAPKPGTFAEAAADYIESDEVATWALQDRFTEATCDEPLDVKVGTTFQCTAESTDGFTYVFLVEIIGERRFRVETVQPSD